MTIGVLPLSGGGAGALTYTEFWIPDPTYWEDTGFTAPIHRGAVWRVGTEIYLFGGLTTPGGVRTAAIYKANWPSDSVAVPGDPANPWQNTGAVLPYAQWANRLILLGNDAAGAPNPTLFIVGSNEGVSPAPNIILSAPLATPTVWTDTGINFNPLVARRESASYFVWQSKIAIVGGFNGGGGQTDSRYTNVTTPLAGWTTGSTSLGSEPFRCAYFVYRNTPTMLAGWLTSSCRLFSNDNFPNGVNYNTISISSFPSNGDAISFDVGDGIAMLGVGNQDVGLWNESGTYTPLGGKLPYSCYFPWVGWIGDDGRAYYLAEGVNAGKIIRSGRRKVYVPTDSIALQESLFGPYADLYGYLSDGSMCRVPMHRRMGVQPWYTNVRVAF